MQAFVDRFRYKNTKAEAGAGPRQEAREDASVVELPEGRKTVRFRFPQPPRTGELVISARGRAQGLRRQRRLRGPRPRALPRRQGRARRPERRRQVDAAQDARRACWSSRRASGRSATTSRSRTSRSTSSRRSTWTRRSSTRSTASRPAGRSRRCAVCSGAFLFTGDDVDKKVTRAVGRGEGPARAGQDAREAGAVPVPGRADEPPRHRLERRARAGAAALRGHDRAHHARPAPHPRRREQGRRGAGRAGDASSTATTTTTCASANSDAASEQRRRRRRGARPAPHADPCHRRAAPRLAAAAAASPAQDQHRRRTPRRVHRRSRTGSRAVAPTRSVSGPKTKEQKRAEAEARNRAYRATQGPQGRGSPRSTPSSRRRRRATTSSSRLMAEPELYADRAAFDAAMAEYTDAQDADSARSRRSGSRLPRRSSGRRREQSSDLRQRRL